VIPIRDTIPSRHPPVVTYLLIFANLLIFFFELTLPPGQLERLFYLFGIVPARYTHPAWAAWVGFPIDDYWPFFTSIFLHAGWGHVIGNMWTLWIFGDNVEDRMGPLRFLAFYLCCGIAAGVTHWLTNSDSPIPTVGASGAIAGVLGAYFVLFPRSRIIAVLPVFFFPFFFELPAVLYLFFWLMTQLLSGTLSSVAAGEVGGVAWWAHVGGFAAGLVLHPFFLGRRRRRYRKLELDEYGLEGGWRRAR